MDHKPKAVFMGSPEFAVPSLRALADICEVMGVITQPDKPAGRGMVLTPPPVKLAAIELGIPCLQPRKLKEESAFEQLKGWRPDVIVVVAFGQLLPKNVLDIPPFGCINVHASLLPAYRGAAPIQAALINGDKKTGVTIMKMDEGLDTGPIISVIETPIDPGETGASLFQKLSFLGANALKQTLPAYLAGAIQPVPQPTQGVSYYGMIRKEDGQLTIAMNAIEVERKIRAFNPWPGASLQIGEETLKIHQGQVARGESLPGTRGVVDGYPAVGFMGGWLILTKVQPAGKKAMDGKAYLAGKRDWLTRT